MTNRNGSINRLSAGPGPTPALEQHNPIRSPHYFSALKPLFQAAVPAGSRFARSGSHAFIIFDNYTSKAKQ